MAGWQSTVAFSSVLAQPDLLLSQSRESKKKGLEVLKELYSFVKANEPKHVDTPLESLIVDGFDLEQIWEELQLQSQPMLDYIEEATQQLNKADVVKSLKPLQGGSSRSKSQQSEEQEGDSASSEMDEGAEGESDSADEEHSESGMDVDQGEDEDAEQMSEEEEEEEPKPAPKSKKEKAKPAAKKGASQVDDEFFKLDDMEAFLDRQERDGADDEIDLDNLEGDDDEDDEDEEEDADARDVKYEDFFGSQDGEEGEEDEDEEGDEEEDEQGEGSDDGEGSGDGQKSKKKNKSSKLLEASDSEEGEDTEGLTKYEREQAKMKKRIAALEEFNVGEKPWELTGEVASRNRPLNSLLETDLGVEYTARPAPEITEEYGNDIEAVIRRRIRDNLFDDVERKVKPAEQAEGPAVTLDQEKSKVGLADIYERKFLEKSGVVPTAAEEAIDAAHKELDMLFAELEENLTALTNFHYTPRQVHEDLTVTANVPTVKMEEVIPLAVADSTRLAPEEVHQKPKGDVVAVSEKSDTDKKRERRKKKAQQHARAEEKKKVEGEQPNIKRAKVETDATGQKKKVSSAKFFQELQQTQAQAAAPQKQKAASTSATTASHLRL